MSEIKLEFSIFADPLVDQLEEQGYRFKSERDEERCQKLFHAWNMLRFYGIQTEDEAQKSRKRLRQFIMESIEPMHD